MPVDVAVEQVFRTITVDKFHETGEAAVGLVLPIAETAWRGVGYDNIGCTPPPEKKTHAANKAGHFLFGILIDSVIIPAGSGEPGDAQPVEVNHASVQWSAAHRRFRFIAVVVVAKDVKKWGVVKVPQGNEIFRGQVTAGDYGFKAAAAGAGCFEEFFFDDI